MGYRLSAKPWLPQLHQGSEVAGHFWRAASFATPVCHLITTQARKETLKMFVTDRNKKVSLALFSNVGTAVETKPSASTTGKSRD
jgi:hypothetical protein